MFNGSLGNVQQEVGGCLADVLGDVQESPRLDLVNGLGDVDVFSGNCEVRLKSCLSEC